MPPSPDEIRRDLEIRQMAFAFVQRLVDDSDDGTVTREQLQRFEYRGESIRLLDTGRGIRNPRQLIGTLSILTTPDSKYDDTPGPDGLLRYAIRDGELGQGDNRKLRRAYEHRLPLVWFYGVRSAVFVPLMPVFLLAEEYHTKRYVVAIGNDQRMATGGLPALPIADTRDFVERMTRERFHHAAFRARVMHAYGVRCAVCSLAGRGLLDATHILDDGHPRGGQDTKNGLALCKIHRAAYDQNIIGISPDYLVFVSENVLRESDGPMMKHGIQAFHRQPLLVVPTRRDDRPDPERLYVRYEEFGRCG